MALIERSEAQDLRRAIARWLKEPGEKADTKKATVSTEKRSPREL
jgi:hypothetical protein